MKKDLKLLIKEENKILHLAYFHHKERVRKKNLNRLVKFRKKYNALLKAYEKHWFRGGCYWQGSYAGTFQTSCVHGSELCAGLGARICV